MQLAVASRQIQISRHKLLLSLLQGCPSMKQLKQLHAQLITLGLAGDTLAVAEVVAFCSVSGSGSGDLRYGREVFDRVEKPNRFMWNSLIRGYSNSDRPVEAIFLCRRMLGSGFLPNEYTLPFVLKACASELALTEARLIHGMVYKVGFGEQVFVMNSLLNVYVACGSIGLANEVFDEIPHRNAVTWNTMIDGYSRTGDCEKVIGLFGEMRNWGLEPDEFTLVSLLSVCSQMGNVELGRAMHNYVVVTGVDRDVIVGNALMDMYGKCGELDLAQKCFDKMHVRNVVSWTTLVCAHAKHGQVDIARCWFDRMPERSVVSWNAMIACYVQHGLYREALGVYTHMRVSKEMPDEATLVNVLSTCSQNGNLIIGMETHDYICENVANPSITLLNCVVDMYAKCGPIDVALDLFMAMRRRNVVSWNVIINALAMHGRASEAVEFFRRMVGQGFSPDGITFVGLLSACSHGGLLEVGQHYFKSMALVYRIPHEIEHYACMVDLLGRAGNLREAVELIANMPMRPDVVIWGALLGACRIHVNVNIGKKVMKQLLESEPYSGGLHVLISNIFCDTQRWEDVKKLRKLMKEKGIKKGKATSLIEMNGNVYEFMVEDVRHENSGDIHLLLDQLGDHLVSADSLPYSLEASFVEE